jgi:hypothetical protein
LRAQFARQPETRAIGVGRDLHGLRKNKTEFPVENIALFSNWAQHEREQQDVSVLARRFGAAAPWLDANHFSFSRSREKAQSSFHAIH